MFAYAPSGSWSGPVARPAMSHRADSDVVVNSRHVYLASGLIERYPPTELIRAARDVYAMRHARGHDGAPSNSAIRTTPKGSKRR